MWRIRVILLRVLRSDVRERTDTSERRRVISLHLVPLLAERRKLPSHSPINLILIV